MKTLAKTEKYNSYQSTWNGLPALIGEDFKRDSLKRSFLISLTSHFILAVSLWLLGVILVIFGIAPNLFEKPKMKDIEFTIAKSAQKIQSTEQSAPATKPEIQPATPKTQSTPKEIVQNKPTPKTKAQKTAKSAKSHSQMQIPDFDIPMPSTKTAAGASKNKIRHQASGIETSDMSISESATSSASGGSSHAQNGFDKGAAQKIATPYDISPYINELKKNVHWNWKLPAGHANKRVELFLRIARDGKLIILNVKTTAEDAALDNAAMNAVRKTTPLHPLPSRYSKGFLDVVLIFDAATGAINQRH